MAAEKTIFFVCTGNVCRSPMAVGLFYDKLVREKKNKRVRIRSAGIWALEEQPASAYARQVMSEHDLDISAHRGRNLTQPDVDEADLILVMTKRHAEIIARDLKRSAGKVYLLSEMAGPSYDVADPYGGSLPEYRQTAAELASLIERGCARIMKLLGS
jgi:protein-tyrosine-phosphatase